jgi:hypothetical protein
MRVKRERGRVPGCVAKTQRATSRIGYCLSRWWIIRPSLRVYEKVVGKREEKEYPHLQTQQDGESREELPSDGNE